MDGNNALFAFLPLICTLHYGCLQKIRDYKLRMHLQIGGFNKESLLGESLFPFKIALCSYVPTVFPHLFPV